MDITKSRGLLRSPLPSLETPTLPPVSAEGKTRVDTLLEQVDSILPSADVSVESQKSYVVWFQKACTDCDTAKYASQRLHHYWLSNRQAVSKAAVFLCANWMAEINGVKLRTDILSILEDDFIGRQSMQAKSPEKFLNAAAFLVEIFIHIRIEKLPLSVLTTPVFEYFGDLLSGDESEIELLAHLVIDVTPTLAALQECGVAATVSYAPLQTLFSKVRSTLISRNLSSVSRLWLLFIMDISSSGALKLPSITIQEFYKDKDHLGTDVEGLLKSLQIMQSCEEKDAADSKSETISDNHSQHSRTSSISSLKNDRDVNNQVRTLNISEKISLGAKKKNPVRVDHQDKRDNFRSAFNLDSKGSKGKSYWLHDDRFDREDNSPRDKKSENFSRPRASQSNWRRTSNDNNDKDASPKTNDSNWREPSAVQPSVVVQSSSVHNSAVQSDRFMMQDLAALAGHVMEENWDD